MNKLTLIGLALIGALPAVAHAKDATPCANGMVCASRPDSVVSALQTAGYKAKLTKDLSGDPEIDTSFSGYDVQLYFYGCEEHVSCDSLQFNVGFKAIPKYTIDYANKWNRKNRFYKAYIADDLGLVFSHDVDTVGGMSQTNFADVASWADSMTGEISKFFDASDPKK